jgi:hypothetical protein
VPYSPKCREILEALRDQLDLARSEFHAANKEFEGIVNDTPSGIPQPDGSFRVQRAGQASRAALQNYRRALKRFSDFTLEGAVPDDLLRRD